MEGNLGPAALSPERLEEMVSGSFLDVASKAHPTKSGLEDLLKDDLLVVEPTTMKSWNEAVTCAYLNRFGLPGPWMPSVRRRQELRHCVKMRRSHHQLQ